MAAGLGSSDFAGRSPQVQCLSVGGCVFKLSGTQQYIEAVNDFLGDRFFYGTGYPVAPLADYFEKFKGLGIKAEYMDKVLYQNLEKYSI